MSWQYRVVVEAGEYSLREVYSGGLWSGDPRPSLGDSLESLKADFTLMAQAFTRPVLEIRGERLVQVSE